MRMPLRKDYDVTGSKTYRRFVAKLDIAITLRNQVEDHHPLGPRLEQWCGRICTRGLVAPGRRKSCIDEDGAYQSYDPKGFRQCIHYAASTSIRSAIGTASRAAADIGEHRLLSSTRSRRRSAETPAAEIRT